MSKTVQQRLERFRIEAAESVGQLEFIFENLCNAIPSSSIPERLSQTAVVFAKLHDATDHVDREWMENLRYVVPLFIGEMIVRETAGEWKSETRKSRVHYGLHYITGFGDMEWEMYYPETARRVIEQTPAIMVELYTGAIKIWETRNRIVDATVDYLANSQNPVKIEELMNHFETIQLAPQRKFGASRFKQFEKRTINVLKTIQTINVSRDMEIQQQHDV